MFLAPSEISDQGISSARRRPRRATALVQARGDAAAREAKQPAPALSTLR